jgi:hypothetical protein
MAQLAVAGCRRGRLLFFVAVGSTGRGVSQALSPLPTLMAAAIFLVASRQPVVGRDIGRIIRPVAVAGLVAAIVGLVLYQTVMPQRFTGWLVLLAALMVAPYLVGAWRWLRP